MILALVLSSRLWAAECGHGSDRFNCVEFVRAIDGDTVVVDLPGVHPYFGSKAQVRLNGVDTPESRSKDACEVKLARIAKKLVESNLRFAKRIDLKLPSDGKGKLRKEKYGRILADILFDGKDLAASLLAQGLAVRYEGKTKQRTNWCQLGARYLK